MAKKQTQLKQEDEIERQSRKEILRARKEAEQNRRVRLAVAGVGGLLLFLLLFAVINELIIAPRRPVATINNSAGLESVETANSDGTEGDDITLRQWQDRVRFERAQRVRALENQYEAFGGDVGIIQQFSLQTIQELLEPEALAEGVLNQMISETIIRQEAEKRGITVSDEELEEQIGSLFNYFDGESPTPMPTPEETIVPTPSLTPIPTPVITDVVPTTTPFPSPTLGPTATSLPTATPVSQESFEEQLGEVLSDFDELGVQEDVFRESIRSRIYLEKLAEALGEENETPTEALHASIYYLSFSAETDADEAFAMIQEEGFLPIWNTIRSTPPDFEAEATTTASELLWRTEDNFATDLGEEVAELAFTLPPGVPSMPVEAVVDAETSNFYIIQISGREVRELAETTVQNAKTQLVFDLVDVRTAVDAEIMEFWRDRVPTQPILDPKFLAQPTPTPAIPAGGIEIPSE